MTHELLKGKKALITGSSRGIGRATAIAMAEAGADIVIHYNKQLDLAEETAADVRKRGREALVIQANMEDNEAIDNMFATIEKEWGSLDIFMANAAATAFKPLMDIKPHHLNRTYQLIINSLVHAAQKAVPLMPESGGRIITISGHGVDFTLPNYSTIGSAKSSVESLTKYLAYELGEQGITCNAIAPGVVDTDSARFYMGEEQYAHFEKTVSDHTPLHRLAQPKDIADVAVFLGSDLSRFITGDILKVDGGLTHTSGPFEITK